MQRMLHIDNGVCISIYSFAAMWQAIEGRPYHLGVFWQHGFCLSMLGPSDTAATVRLDSHSLGA